MPQLNEATAAKVEKAESGFALLDPGIYIVQLHSVEVKQSQSGKGPYWAWRFDIPEGEAHEGRRFYENTSLSEAAYFRLKAVFAAFEVPTTTDTDELVGRKIRIALGHETQQQGQNIGTLRNSIDHLLPLEGPTGTGVDFLKEIGITVKMDVTEQDPSDGSFDGGSKDEPLF